MKKSPPKKSFTITEAAKKLNISRQGIHDLIRRKIIPASRGKIVQTKIVTVEGWKISAKALEAYRRNRNK